MSVQPPQISPSTKYRKFAPNFYLISTKSSRDGETTIAVIRWVAQPGLRNRGDTSTFSGGKRLRREKISSETSSSIRVFSFRSCCLSLHEFFQRFCAALPPPRSRPVPVRMRAPRLPHAPTPWLRRCSHLSLLKSLKLNYKNANIDSLQFASRIWTAVNGTLQSERKRRLH